MTSERPLPPSLDGISEQSYLIDETSATTKESAQFRTDDAVTRLLKAAASTSDVPSLKDSTSRGIVVCSVKQAESEFMHYGKSHNSTQEEGSVAGPTEARGDAARFETSLAVLDDILPSVLQRQDSVTHTEECPPPTLPLVRLSTSRFADTLGFPMPSLLRSSTTIGSLCSLPPHPQPMSTAHHALRPPLLRNSSSLGHALIRTPLIKTPIGTSAFDNCPSLAAESHMHIPQRVTCASGKSLSMNQGIDLTLLTCADLSRRVDALQESVVAGEEIASKAAHCLSVFRQDDCDSKLQAAGALISLTPMVGQRSQQVVTKNMGELKLGISSRGARSYGARCSRIETTPVARAGAVGFAPKRENGNGDFKYLRPSPVAPPPRLVTSITMSVPFNSRDPSYHDAATLPDRTDANGISDERVYQENDLLHNPASGIFLGASVFSRDPVYNHNVFGAKTPVDVDLALVNSQEHGLAETKRIPLTQAPRDSTQRNDDYSHNSDQSPKGQEDLIGFFDEGRLSILPRLDAFARRTHPRLFSNVPTSERPCKCKNTYCLKLYCNCFQSGSFCNPKICRCSNCKNTEQESGKEGVRAAAIAFILERRKDAFELRDKKRSSDGCGCSKNR